MASLCNHSAILAASLLWAVMAGPTMAARYIKPNADAELFQLEKILLQVHHMRELSQHLVVLACREQSHSPADQRATAQLLALAMRLDPTNGDARATNRARAEGSQPETAQETQLLKSQARVIFFQRWLSTPEAGNEANLLATYLADATKVLRPDALNQADVANWSGVLPPLRRYTFERPDQPPKDPPPGKIPGKTPVAPTPAPRFHITELSVHSAFDLQHRGKVWNREQKKFVDSGTATTHKIATVKVNLTPATPDTKNHITLNSIVQSIHFPTPASDPIFNRIKNSLVTLLTRRHRDLPTNNARITVSEGQYARSNTPEMLVAPVALLLEASLNNTPIRSDVHICALIDDQGRLSLPNNFWQSLQTYRTRASGGRLIVPTGAYELLSQQLVYGDPGFFTRWEVVAADNLDHALALATTDDKGPMAEASQQFESIRTAAEKTSVTQLTVNKMVRSRLTRMLELAPNHLSAKLLLLQGSGKRPMRFNQRTLALVLLPSVKKIHSFLKNELHAEYLPPSAFKKTHDEVRAEIDPLLDNRLLDSSYNPLYQDVLALATELRLLEKSLIRANKDEQDYSGKAKALKRFFRLQRDAAILLEKTLVAAGMPPAPQKPKAPAN